MMKMAYEKTTEVSYNGIGFGGLLTILFIGLKLTGQVDWDWIWVVAPLWAPIAIVLGSILLVGAGVFLYAFLEVFFNYLIERKKNK